MKTNSTKKSLIVSILSITMCLAMLIGTTVAWFVDSASTSVSSIQSGTLNVDIVDAEGNIINDQTLAWQKAAGHENEEVLWEPGCTYNLQPFAIKNNGNLALKFKVIITGVAAGDAKLLEVIDWKIGDAPLADFEGNLTPGATTEETYTISGTMQQDAGNDYQGLSVDGIRIEVVATQHTYENDSNDDQYDVGAVLPGTTYQQAAAVVDSLFDSAYNMTDGNQSNFTWAQLQEKYEALANVDFYVPFADKTADETLVIGGVTYTADSDFSLSIGNNNFLVDKAIDIRGDKIYLAAPIATLECAVGNVKLNQVALNGGNAITPDANGVYNVALPNGTTMLGLFYEGAEADDVAVTRKVITDNGVTTVSYGTTGMDTVNGSPCVALYPAGWHPADLGSDFVRDTDYSVYIVGKGFCFNAKLHITPAN